MFPAQSSTIACVSVGKPRPKLATLSLSSGFLGFYCSVLESVYLTLRQYPWGFTRFIHSSTHNEYYYWNYLSFQGVFLEAFLPLQAFKPLFNTRPHDTHPAPKYSQPRRFAESLSTP
jgi:hypothetical protein